MPKGFIMKFIGYAIVISLAVFSLQGCTSGNPEQNKSKNWWPEILSEKDTVDVYLPDFSFAGYYWGEKQLPEWQETINISEFGAIPDDNQDDTGALKKAFQAANQHDGPVVLKLDRGRYILKDILYIDRSQFVLRGEGSGKDGTTIYMPQPLNKLKTPADMTELEEYLTVNNKRQKEPDRGID
jgi:hypothetical protein